MKFLVWGYVGLAVLSARASLDVAVGAGDALPVVTPSETVARLKAEISSDAAAGQISFTARNVLGGETTTRRTLTFKDGRSSVPVLDAPLAKGAYDIVWVCTVGAEVSTGAVRIAVCDSLEPSQGLDGEFLFGTHAHLQCCKSLQEEELEVRAAARAGFKVMRIDLAWSEMEPSPGAIDWSIGERRVALLEKYGILPQVLVGLAPNWAVKKDWIYERPERGPCGNKLPEPGPWRDFLRKMAAHFGARIPFYELYNEPDLIGFGNFSVEDYVASFNAGAQGIRVGCPSARILTGGIACWRKTIDTKKDFLPRGVLGTAENFDILAIHEHGTAKGFFRTLDENWLSLLKKHSIEKPIWPNETSVDARCGEAVQAACYMKKALFSWSRGCCAHNWYKVRDSRLDLAETRLFYGLLSRDFEPLAAYPAVAGTVSLYRDAHFVRELPNEDMELLLFSKSNRLVLAGWPHNPGSALKPRPVKIRTDAADAFFVDLMGNSRPLQIANGVVVFDVGRFIGSLVLIGASTVEAIANPPLPQQPPVRIAVPAGDFPSSPQLVLDKPEQYTSHAGFNPATEHLMWEGPSDLSAKYWFKRDGDMLTIRAEVTDDAIRFSTTPVPHAGDALTVAFSTGGRFSREWIKSVDGRIYERAFSLAALGVVPGVPVRFNTQIWDNDDGRTAEGFIGISGDMSGKDIGGWAEIQFEENDRKENK